MKHFSLKKVVILSLVVATWLVPTVTNAANFSCTSVSKSSTAATLALKVEAGGKYSVDDVTIVLAQANLDNGSFINSDRGRRTASDDQYSKVFGFAGLQPSTAYEVVAFDENSAQIEQIPSCGFVTAAAASAAPAAAATVTTSNVKQPSAPKSAVSDKGGSVFDAPSTGDMGLIPCDGPECDLNSFFQLLNNLISFFFSTLLLPLFVLMILYLGYSYIAAQGKPGQHAKLGNMAKHMVLGLVLMLCAWVIVRTILVAIGFQDSLGFFGN